MNYSAGLVSQSFWFVEIRKIIKLVNEFRVIKITIFSIILSPFGLLVFEIIFYIVVLSMVYISCIIAKYIYNYSYKHQVYLRLNLFFAQI